MSTINKEKAVKRGIYKTDLDILLQIRRSNCVRECLLSLYQNKKPSNAHYRKVSLLMIESGVRFLNGEVYVHPSLQELYELKKDNKPLIKIK